MHPIAKKLQREIEPRVSVICRVSDWRALVNFVNGDLAGMPEDDPNRLQMQRILNRIRMRTAKHE